MLILWLTWITLVIVEKVIVMLIQYPLDYHRKGANCAIISPWTTSHLLCPLHHQHNTEVLINSQQTTLCADCPLNPSSAVILRRHIYLQSVQFTRSSTHCQPTCHKLLATCTTAPTVLWHCITTIPNRESLVWLSATLPWHNITQHQTPAVPLVRWHYNTVQCSTLCHTKDRAFDIPVACLLYTSDAADES